MKTACVALVFGGYMGVPFFIKGTADGFAAPVVLKDKEGGHLETGRFWDPDKKKHTDGKAPEGARGDRAYAALAIDWDDDGDLDLLRGTSNGGLFLRENEGTPGKHAYATTTKAVKIGGEPAMVPGGYAFPVAADCAQQGNRL
jgi:hypothetical protein